MSLDDFGGALWGALGGLVRWLREQAGVTWPQRLTAFVSSLAAGIGLGHLTAVLIQWQLPNVPEKVANASGFVSGMSSSILILWGSAVLTEIGARSREWLLGKLFPRPEVAPNGPVATGGLGTDATGTTGPRVG